MRLAASYLSSQTGIEVTLDRVRLSFPLDVSLGGVRAVQDGDTLLAVNRVLVDLDMTRLWSLSIGVDAVELADGMLHTGPLIPAVSIDGTVGLLHLDAGAINIKKGEVKAVSALLERSDIEVSLHESTEEEDTTTSPAPLWSIAIERAEVSQSRLLLHMPGDSMRIEAGIGQLLLEQGNIDLYSGIYTAQSLTLRADSLLYSLPHDTLPATGGINPSHIALDSIGLQVDSVRFSGALAGAMHSGTRIHEGAMRIADRYHLWRSVLHRPGSRSQPPEDNHSAESSGGRGAHGLCGFLTARRRFALAQKQGSDSHAGYCSSSRQCTSA